MPFNKIITLSILITALFMTGCSKEKEQAKVTKIDTIPESSYTDAKKCHLKTHNTPEPVISFLLSAYNDSEVFTKEYKQQEIDKAIARGCDVNEVGSKGSRPLQIAVVYNLDDQIKNLMAHGADPNLTYSNANNKNIFEFSEDILKNAPPEKREKREKTNTLVQSYKK